MMHGQGLAGVGERVLRRAGYEVRGINDAHICCGSAGSYSLFQPEISGKLKQRKAANIIQAGGSVMASANLGCMTHLASALPIPTAHHIELVDWAMGGPIPPSIMAARAKSLNH
jgi:Fe-S oxidoreductase